APNGMCLTILVEYRLSWVSARAQRAVHVTVPRIRGDLGCTRAHLATSANHYVRHSLQRVLAKLNIPRVMLVERFGNGNAPRILESLMAGAVLVEFNSIVIDAERVSSKRE